MNENTEEVTEQPTNNVVVSDDNVAKIDIEFQETELDNYSRQYLKEKRKHVTVNGFRKGNAPEKMIEKAFKDEARKAASNAVLQSKYSQALQEHRLQPLADPKLETFKDENGKLTAQLVVEVLPPIVLGQYLGLEIETRPLPSLEDGMAKTLKTIRYSYPKYVDLVDTQAVSGNVATIDFTMGVGDKSDWEVQKDFKLKLGSGMYFPEFEAAIVGSKIGEMKEFDLTFPEDYQHADLKAKTAHFTLTVKNIQEVVDNTDEDLSKLLGYEDFDKMKAALASELEAKYKDDEHYYQENQILGQLLAAHPFKIPQKLIDEEIRKIRTEKPDLTPDEATSIAERFVRTDIVLHAIYERHPEIQMKQEDFNAKFAELSIRSKDPSVEETIKKLQQKGLLQKYVNYLTNCKVIEFLIEMADKKETTPQVVVEPGNTVVSTEESTEEKQNG